MKAKHYAACLFADGEVESSIITRSKDARDEWVIAKVAQLWSDHGFDEDPPTDIDDVDSDLISAFAEEESYLSIFDQEIDE